MSTYCFSNRKDAKLLQLGAKKKLIYNELIWHFIHSKITLGNTYEKVVFIKISGLQPANANKSEVTYK